MFSWIRMILTSGAIKSVFVPHVARTVIMLFEKPQPLFGSRDRCDAVLMNSMAMIG